MNRIVILGAGYAGLITAVSLAGRTRRREDVQITIVNAEERFTERLRLHQTASGQRLADLRIPELLAGTRVEFVRGWVTGIDTAAHRVRVDDGREIEYDRLVYALGATADTDTVPGVGEHAYTLDSAHDAELLARKLASLGRGTVVVCGGGLTGVEAAAEVAEQHPGLDVVLLGRQEPGSMMAPKAKAHLHAGLARLGVRVVNGVEIVKVRPGSVDLADGTSVQADAVLWTSGVRVPVLAAAAGLRVDGSGRIVTDPALRSVSHPQVYAVGDAAAIQQGYGVLHGTCGSGLANGVHAATSIVRELDGGEPRTFRFGYIHAAVSLGRHDAVIQFTHPDDSPKRFFLTGRPAVWYKETVSSIAWPSFGQLKTFPAMGAFVWRRGGRFTR
ncbi:NAD(P)/FAD-dependent oxidoreductase [Micromonospora musae]|uniref:FAD-dependent oxidoreductase n=1 Tax=Micromonospora musae TaxID=1894970 RepID=A0A3A9XVX9_9ACTN|nr:FAD-dependent oxidoreductase [Micromonospora musae]RKN29288.1 FAD-dependent oxidoreductase [Micromonospora musae]